MRSAASVLKLESTLATPTTPMTLARFVRFAQFDRPSAREMAA